MKSQVSEDTAFLVQNL